MKNFLVVALLLASSVFCVKHANPVVTGFTVQKGLVERSYVRYLDIEFASDVVAADHVYLTRYNLDGSGPGVVINLTGVISIAGTTMSFDFGDNGIGGNRNTIAGNGYYVLSLDLDDDGIFETTLAFYRLFGDANGDGIVNAADWNFILHAYGQTGPLKEADVNGDGIVNSLDRTLSQRQSGVFLNPLLPIDD